MFFFLGGGETREIIGPDGQISGPESGNLASAHRLQAPARGAGKCISTFPYMYVKVLKKACYGLDLDIFRNIEICIKSWDHLRPF